MPSVFPSALSRHNHHWMLIKKTEHSLGGELLVTHYQYKCSCGAVLEQSDG